MAEEPPAQQNASRRLVALDAYRGFVMFLMAAELLNVPDVAKKFPDSTVWQFLRHNTTHVAWMGCSLHDLIQPSFSFLTGVALPFSMAARMSKEQSIAQMWRHALWRSLLLVLLGVFLRSIDHPMTNWTFGDTLSQIGLGYPFLFALGFAGNKARWVSLAVILIGYWMAFACFRLPPDGFDYALMNVPNNWENNFVGFAAHWNINSNAAWYFDTWFLNLFPREHPFTGNAGGYCTLSFIPTLGTMLLGLLAGSWLQECRSTSSTKQPLLKKASTEKLTTKLIVVGLACIALGWLLHSTNLCPIVKKIWTPSWTLFSGGWCFLLLSLFYIIIEVQGSQRWAFPLVVIGMNSIAMYVLVHISALSTHFGHQPFLMFGETFAPMLHGACLLFMLWLILWWMQRRKIFLRI